MPLSTTLVATAKNEAPYIWEWVAYHRVIGFDNIILFQNDSTDGTNTIFKALHNAGIVQGFNNRAGKGMHQIRAYERAAELPEYQSSDWAMALDLDEFLAVHTEEGTVQSLIKAFPEDTDSACISWKRFGANGQNNLEKGLVTERFTMAEKDHVIARRAVPYKSLYKTKRFVRPGIHRPKPFPDDTSEKKLVNSSGLTQDKFVLKNFQASDPNQRELAQVNHYRIRDAESFCLKSYKGSAHQTDRAIGEKYWRTSNLNHKIDRSALRFDYQVRLEMARIDAMTKGRLYRLTNKAIAKHKAKFTEIMADPELKQLYTYCCNT